MKLIILPLVFALSWTSLIGQQSLGIKASFGTSMLKTSYSYSTDHSDYFRPTGQVGFTYKYNITNRSIIGSDLQFFQIRGKEHAKLALTDDFGDPIGILKLDIWRNISYLGLPLYYGYNFKNLTFCIGIQTSVTLFSSGKERSEYPDLNGDPVITENEFSGLNIDMLNVGPIANIKYNLTDKSALELMYYYGVNNIQQDIHDWKLNPHLLTVGLLYYFISQK